MDKLKCLVGIVCIKVELGSLKDNIQGVRECLVAFHEHCFSIGGILHLYIAVTHEDVWFGIFGARLGAGAEMSYCLGVHLGIVCCQTGIEDHQGVNHTNIKVTT